VHPGLAPAELSPFSSAREVRHEFLPGSVEALEPPRRDPTSNWFYEVCPLLQDLMQ
jgi:hypothetical protein